MGGSASGPQGAASGLHVAERRLQKGRLAGCKGWQVGRRGGGERAARAASWPQAGGERAALAAGGPQVGGAQAAGAAGRPQAVGALTARAASRPQASG
ncbi:unnamed protein product [Closterium sp. NIES-54]